MPTDRRTIYRMQEVERRLTDADRTLGTSLIRPRNDPVAVGGGVDRLRRVMWKANLAGGGKYLGKIINYSAGDIAGAGNLSNTGDIGDATTSKVTGFVGAAADCIVLNSAERGRATHIWDGWSQSGTKDLWIMGEKIGVQVATDGATGILAGMEIIVIDLCLPQAQTAGEILVLDADGAPWSVGQAKLEN